MAATPHRNRRAYSETSPNLTNFGTETGSQQRSFSTSDISPERLEEGSVFDFSPLPTDLPETSQTDSEMAFERDPAPVGDASSSQQIPVEVSDFIIRRQIESENNSLGSIAETESVATRMRTDLHIETHMHDFSDFLDEFLEFELHHRNSNGSLEPTTVDGNTSMDRPVLGSMQNTSDSLQATQTGESSNGSCLYASNTTSVHEAWPSQTPVLYTSSELGFDYHSHLSSNHSNTSNARSDGFQARSLVRPPFTSALDLSNIATTSYSQSTIAINSGNISPSSTASYSLSQRSPRAQTASQSMSYPTSWDTGQRSQCLLPVQNVQRDPSCTTDPSSNRTNLDKEGGTKDPQCENAIAHPTGARKKRMVKKDKWSSKSSATGTEKSLPNEENNNKDNSQTTDAAQEPETDSAVSTTSQKDKTPNGGAVQEQDISSSSSETTTNMLPFTEEISMLTADNVSIFDQFEDRQFPGFDMFPNNMMPPQDFSMGEKHQAMAQPMASPMSPPEGDMFTADATFLELGNYCYSNQPSPTSTDISEQEMTEAYEIVMEDILSTITPRLGISTDPSQWSQEEAQAWISLLIQEYGRPEVNLSNFQVDGYTLCQMTQEELEQRAPGSGYLILSNLNCLTKSIQRDEVKPVLSPYQQQQHFHQQQQQQQQQPPQPQAQPMTYDPNMMYTYPMTSIAPTSPAATERELSPSPSSSDEEEASMSSPARSPTGPNTSMTPHHTGSIQLWQFLQELLLQPDSYNYCIRFLDRTQGIFKIEDSVEVARLWGMRKNRPAMNYDKLSRSIRQYYRKGIMKKTEISQRLVYQFVTPF